MNIEVVSKRIGHIIPLLVREIENEAMIHLGGYILLFGLMIYFTFKDVLRILRGKTEEAAA